MAMVPIPVEGRLTEYLHNKAAMKGVPLSGSFELTPCCNMACKMCYVRMTKAEQEAHAPLRTAEEWIDLGCAAKERGMLYLLLTGGEPFLRPDFREIFQGLHALGLILSINSNATLINEETVAWLKQTPPTRINITLYGASDETYERLCGNPKGYTQATTAIRLLREAGISVKLNYSVTPDNAADLAAVFAFAQKESLILQATSYMFPPLRRDETMVGCNHRFAPEDAAYYAAQIARMMNGDEAFLDRMKEGLPPIPQETEDCMDAGPGEGIRCRAGKCSFWVTWTGTFLPCGMMPQQGAPNVFNQGFDAAWEQAKSFAGAIRLSVKCAACEARDSCKACAAMVYTESGGFGTIPQYRCAMTKAYPEACKRVMEEIVAPIKPDPMKQIQEATK